MAKPSPKFAGNEFLVALGGAIRQARNEQALSQEGLAAEAELDRSYMGGVERGEHNITVMNLIKVCQALKRKPSKLFESTGL